MSDENLTPEELPMEDKKKAINLQDLVYVKKYIDDNYYDKTYIDANIDNKVDTAIKDNCYTKAEIDENHYTNTETDQTFYKKTDTVDEAAHAEVATNAVNAVVKPDGTYIGLVVDEDGTLKYNDDSTMLEAQFAKHAAIATNSVMMEDDSYSGFMFGEDSGLYFDDYTVVTKELLYKGPTRVDKKDTIITLNKKLKEGDKIEVIWSYVNDYGGEGYQVAVPKASSIGYYSHSSPNNDISLSGSSYRFNTDNGASSGIIAPIAYSIESSDTQLGFRNELCGTMHPQLGDTQFMQILAIFRIYERIW